MGTKHDEMVDNEIEEIHRWRDPDPRMEPVTVIGELNVTDPERHLLVVSVPRDIDLNVDPEAGGDGWTADLIEAVATAVERRRTDG